MGANGKEGREGEGEGMRSKTGPPYTEACTKVVAAKPSKPISSDRSGSEIITRSNGQAEP